jgi:hypothetical protein
VVLYGKVLPAGIKGGKSDMDLTEEQFLGTPVLRLLKMQRLEVVRAPEKWEPPRDWLKKLRGEEPDVEVDEDEELPPEPSDPHPDRARQEDGTFQGDDPDTPDTNEAWEGGEPPSDDPPVGDLWTQEKLEAMDRAELQSLAKSLGVGAGGKNAEIIDRILTSQGET